MASPAAVLAAGGVQVPKVVSTESTAAVDAGATSMKVEDVGGFEAGQDVNVGVPKTKNFEVAKVKETDSAGSIIFEEPLKFGHPAATKVSEAIKLWSTVSKEAVEAEATSMKVGDMEGIKAGQAVNIGVHKTETFEKAKVKEAKSEGSIIFEKPLKYGHPADTKVSEAKKSGKPKDQYAPPKPKNPYSRFNAECRPRLKEERPELLSDLSAMGKALADEWMKVSDAKKAEMQVVYDKEMVVWKPLWAAYKETKNYKEFVEVKTDWLDKRAQKKLVKTMNKEAPKRPRSGYMIFAGTVREAVMEKVRAESLGLAAAGAMISEKWAALTEGQKAEFGEQAQRQKIAYDKDFGEYRKTDAFGNFCDAKAKLESTQQQKKLVRVCLDGAPKKASSGYSLFRSEVMPGILKANEDVKEGETKLSMGEMGKKVSTMWKELSPEKQAEFQAKAVPLKEQYDKDYRQFKTNAKYSAFLEQRQKVKARENLMVNLREMPKRPKSVFSMFSAEHKDEVPPGKGEGKGTSALRAKFVDCPMEEKKKYEAEFTKGIDAWKEKVTEFKAGPKYQTFESTKKKIFMEFKNEAIKVTTLKFLHDAPPGPAKTAFAIFVGEKRKASGEPEGQKKSKEQKREEVVKAKEEWLKLDKGTRDAYEDKRKDLLKGYEEDVKTFMAAEHWQEYQKEAKRLRIPIKSLLYHKKMVMKRLKDGKLSPASVALPEKPDLFPTRPQNAMQIFIAEKKKTVDAMAEISEMWQKMTPEDKAPFDKQAMEQTTKYVNEMKEFKASEEGKLYYRSTASAQRKRIMINSRNKYLDDLPKKSTSAVYEWMKQESKKVKKAEPELKGFELKKKLTDTWTALGEEEKKPFNEAAAERAQAYTVKMNEFKASDNWKRFVSATKVRGKFNGKAKGGGGGGVPVPADMPKKPTNAFQAFMQEQSSEGKGDKLGPMNARFVSLPAEEKKKYIDEAKEREQKYRADFQEFEKSVTGKKFRMASAVFGKRKKMTALKARFLKDEPQKGKAAFFLYVNGSRAKVQADNPDLKGLGPIQGKLSQLWRELSAEDRKPWLDQEKEEQEKYGEKKREFEATEDFKKYRRLSASILGGASKGKAKSKSKAGPAIPMPPKPDNLPKPPLNGMFIFGEETRAGGGPRGVKEVAKLWAELLAEGQKKYHEKAAAQKKQYAIDFAEFQKSVEGKTYLRMKAQATQRKKMDMAKTKFLSADGGVKEPKRPPGAYFIFLGQRSGAVGGDKAQKASELNKEWNAMTAEEKKEYENKAKELKDKYDADMVVYKSSKGFKAFEKFTGSTKKDAKVKAVKVAKAKMSAGRGGGAKAGRGRGAKVARPAAKAAGGGSGSDQMGSDSKSSKSSKKSSSSSSSKKSSKSSKSSASD